MKQIITFAALLLMITACTKKSDSGSPDTTPAAATLTAPASNSTCTVGTVVSATVSTVTFTWNASLNTESYEITIQNLLDNTKVVQTATANTVQVNLNRNTPFAWWVVSRSTKSTATSKSDVYKFYNSGVATSSYAPFPADLTSPGYGAKVSAVAGKVTLTWSGADVDNDITGYDIYIGNSATTLAVIKSDLVPQTWDVSVTSGSTYYWKVVTKDSKGNTSISGVSQFIVN